MSKPMVICEHLTKRFDLSDPWLVRKLTGTPKRELVAVDAVSFEIPRGKTYALVGESGSGKSTIARMVVGLMQPDAGGVTIDGHNLNTSQDAVSLQAVRQTLQMVFQSPYSSLNPRWRVNDILLEPIRAFDLISDEHDQNRRVRELLDQVGLSPSDAAKYPHEFSGGQRQRISIARGLASNPSFMVCDEPTSALDVSVQAQVLNLLKELQRELGLTYLFISHDMAVVRVMAHHIGVLKHGRLVEANVAETLFRNPQESYTKTLINATPKVMV